MPCFAIKIFLAKNHDFPCRGLDKLFFAGYNGFALFKAGCHAQWACAPPVTTSTSTSTYYSLLTTYFLFLLISNLMNL